MNEPALSDQGADGSGPSTAPRLWAVVIGASAGGLEALRQVVPALPYRHNLMVIVALHLSPHHRSMLAELLARETPAPVQEVRDGQVPERGHVYVIPAASQLSIEEGCFRLQTITTAGVPKPNIDRVFQSVAQAFGECTIAAVLSGTGSDGSRGVRAVRAVGGCTLAQQPSDARHDSMPVHAIDSGAINHVVSAAEMASVVSRVIEHQWPQPMVELPEGDESTGLDDVARVVRSGIGFDIGAYKPSTFGRRLQRRMRARACHAVGEYVALLANEPDEQRRLVQEMLISVTGFFRDEQVFEAMATPLREMVRRAAQEERELRLWVAGCATGEEAYSLAMMAARCAIEEGVPNRARIFATDIDTTALEAARKGIYAAGAIDEIPEAWRGGLIVPDGEVLRVSSTLRDMVLFSEHNLLRDPPFLRVDLLSCRNLMIYLQPRWQHWLLQQFQMSLSGSGLLMLGRSETLPANEGFERLANTDLPGLFRCHGRNGAVAPRITPYEGRRPGGRTLRSPANGNSAGELLVAAHSCGVLAPALAMAEDGTLLHTFGDLSRLLQFNKGGPATLDLSQICSPKLWLEMRALAYRARAESGKAVSNLFHPGDDGPPLRLSAVSVRGKGATLVLFEPLQPVVSTGPGASAAERDAEMVALREHVSVTREHLQTLVSELDAANEELQLLNEELQSSNEELQSTNEELETSNEELQSTNEELVTVNEELEVRTAELAKRNTDLHNVKNSLLDALLVLDEHSRVLLRNTAAESLFRFEVDGLQASDRPSLLSLPTLLDMPPVAEATRSVLAGGPPSHAEVEASDGKTYSLGVQPYLAQQGGRCGAVLLLQDVSDSVQLRRRLAATALELGESEAFRRATIDALPDLICVLDDSGCISSTNLAWQQGLVASGHLSASASLGSSYIAACERAAASGDRSAAEFLRGLQTVRLRQQALFEHEYPCSTHQGQRQFRVTVTPFSGTPAGVVVRHQDITELHLQRERLAMQARALDATLNGVVIADASRPELPIVYVNPAFERLTGYSAADVLGRSCSVLQSGDRQQANLTQLRAALQRREGVRVLLRNYRKNGEMFWNELTISMVTDADGIITHMVGVQRDVSSLIASEEALRASQQREAQALAFAGIGTLDWRLRDGMLMLSKQQARLFGLAGNETSIAWVDLRRRVHADDLPLLEDAVKVCVAGHNPLDIEWRVCSADGGTRWLHMLGDAERNAEGTALHLMAISQDVTTRHAAEERATFISNHDGLTGLPNRTLLRDRLHMAIRGAARDRSRLALVFIDLDRFKEVNDSLGHEAGDELLRTVADRLKACVRSSDTVCRLGGDEFVLVLPAVHDADEAASVAEKVLQAVQQPHLLRGQRLQISCSVGVCLYPDDGHDGDSLMRHADAAMYRAKGSGRNTVRFFAHEADANMHRLLALRSELAVAMAVGQLRLHYQPQVSLASGTLIGFEALLRWQHPGRGLLLPDQFLAVLEDTHLIEQVGIWVLRQACEQVVAWRGGPAGGVPIAVNVSPLQLRDKSFVQAINQALGATGVQPQELELELTEHAILHHAEAAAAAMKDLRDMGIGIALDDFGTGFSSLSHLHQHPISKLKIDRSFCAALPHDRNAAAIVRAIIQMANTIGMGVIAEGVEEEAQAAFLRNEGCTGMQGFLQSRALPPDEAVAWMAARPARQVALH